jgi:N-acetylneuraminic acid mutarotase
LPSWKNYLFLIGGFSPRGRLNTIERYNILEDSWKTLNVTLPSEVEAGISIVSAGKSSFYFLYGRGNKDRNEDIFEISISGEESSEKYEISEIGKITKTKVLPAYFVDDDS